MFSWKANNYLLVVDRMSGYIFVEMLHKMQDCHREVPPSRLDTRIPKGSQVRQRSSIPTEFEEFLKDIHVDPTPSSANNPR